jgi:low-density lipoprotein receptor-related protein 4
MRRVFRGNPKISREKFLSRFSSQFLLRSCTNDEFQCLDDACISLAFKCDGEPDCDDNSDEMNCDFPMPNCPEGEFKCKGMLGGMGGPGGRCILQRFRCDGDNDCGDWSDEENCPKKSISCTSNEFKCDDGRCIPLRWRCDQEQDCDSGEDEKDCSDIGNNNRECSDDEYTCKDQRCIPKNWYCDGQPDCKRGEDEMDCDVKCDVGQFSCPSKIISPRERRQNYCVSQKHICDGVKDCLPQGEDEANCSSIHPCPSNTKCHQLCATSSAGVEECSCKVGYVLASDGVSCEDINECEFMNNPCSQTCNNTVGGFM